MRCTFCSRQATNEFDKENLFFCESCGKAYREGFEHGRVYESVRRRNPRKIVKEARKDDDI